VPGSPDRPVRSALLRRGRRPWRFAPARQGIVAALTLGLAATPAAAAEYPVAPGQRVIGDPGQYVTRYVTRQGDVLLDTAQQFDLGYTQLMAANPGVDPWMPAPGRQVVIPGRYILPDVPHRGIVINLAQWRLFYFPPGAGTVVTYPLGLGVIGKTTPLGETRIVRKQANPTWYPPDSIRAAEPDLPAVVPPGPDNPLGAFALYLGWHLYRIHGTNKPDGVGRNVSHGCIRLYPDDIDKLFHAVRVGTPVRVVAQPAEVAWRGSDLYVVAYPSKEQTEDIDIGRPATPDPEADLRELVSAAAGSRADIVDWAAVDRAAAERNGIPVKVGTMPPPAEQEGQEAEEGLFRPAIPGQ
jgi:L,D-transpeptidase ErfK/SrfK